MMLKRPIFRKATSVVLSALLVCAVLPLPPVQAVAEDTLTVREVSACLYNMEHSKKLSCLFSTELPDVPFIDPVTYLNCLYMDDVCSMTKNADGTYTVSNTAGSCVIDPTKDTIHFDSFEQFQKKTAYQDGALHSFDRCQIVDMTIEGESRPTEFDLGAYHIDIVEKDGKVYVPLPTMSTCFTALYNAAEYVGGTIYFFHNGDSPFYSRRPCYENLRREHAVTEYAYNELCFVMDCFYGAPPKGAAAAEVREKGFDTVLGTFSEETRQAKQLLHSDNMLDFLMGMAALYNAFDDGGHTNFTLDINSVASAYGDTAVGKALNEVRSNPANYPQYTAALNAVQTYSQQIRPYSTMMSVRSEAYLSYDVVMEWGDIQLLQKDDMAVFVFNKFYPNVAVPVKEALDYAAENGVRKFVFDLTCNTGGSIYVGAYLVQLMDIKNTHSSSGVLRIRNTQSGNVCLYTGQFDMNLDGVYDKKDDETVYDFDFAVLTSHLSYSAGNHMPCEAYARGIPVFGETSGGGTCVVYQFVLPNGGFFTASCPLMTVNSKNEPMDSGAPLAYDMITSADSPDYHELYDFDHLNQLITDYYSGTIQPAPPKKRTDQSASAQNIWWIAGIAGAAAVIGVCVAVGVVMMKRRKKKQS